MGMGLLLALALLCEEQKQGEVTIHVSSEHHSVLSLGLSVNRMT